MYIFMNLLKPIPELAITYRMNLTVLFSNTGVNNHKKFPCGLLNAMKVPRVRCQIYLIRVFAWQVTSH
jgi:hypothetical protein